MDIALDRDHDNPQLIFESLNSTGLELSQADLIRNYILMGLEPKRQTHLYEQFWYPMEQRFGQEDYSSRFDQFMRNFLTIRTGRIPNIRDVYEAFKAYAQSKHEKSVEQVVSDISTFADYFVNMALERESDPEIRDCFHDINTLRVDVAYPFLLELYDCYARGHVDRSEFIAMLRLVESYVIRRAICGIPTNSLNKTFANLFRELNRMDLLESLKVSFWQMPAYRRFPKDDEFKREFVVKDIYNLSNRRNYLLRKLENFGRKEVVNVEAFSIEHIMPQNTNLSGIWQADLGANWQDVQRTYVHTIGNLTLTGYNPELSDRPFAQKRDMEGGFRESPIRLNRGLGHLNRWNEETIKTRAQNLANLACQVWPQATPSDSSLKRIVVETRKTEHERYSLSDHQYLTGYTLRLFEKLRTRILNLDASVAEEILKLYIAYKTTTNFADIVPQASGLRISLNVEFGEIEDPEGICRDVSDVGRWGNGDVEFKVSSESDIDYAMFLINQSFRAHSDIEDPL